MDDYFSEKIPFFFIIDYLGKQFEVCRLNDCMANGIFFSTPTKKNHEIGINKTKKPLRWDKKPISSERYKIQFEKVKKAIQRGDSYLLNLTCDTPVECNFSLKEIFNAGQSKYKLYYKDVFTHFSPEPFIRIKENKIYSYPMKGTIEADIPNAAEQLLSNEKELKEQYTIVDLIRNDLSSVANKVRVDDFRYIERIKNNQKELLSVSSKISGVLKEKYRNRLGAIFSKMLPVGSVTGAPKLKTVELIQNIEQHSRNYYTGVWGIYDGEKVDSCVIIRYLEKLGGEYHFKSGGGITAMSILEEEYQEMIDKVYLPIF